jgi:hypothetical protein
MGLGTHACAHTSGSVCVCVCVCVCVVAVMGKSMGQHLYWAWGII